MLMRSSNWAWQCWGVRKRKWGYLEKATYTVGKIPIGTTLSFVPAEVPFTSKGMMKRKKNDKKVHFSLGPECWAFISKRMLIKKSGITRLCIPGAVERKSLG